MPRTILITGTSTGLGAHLAVDLATQGHHVFASMRRPEQGKKVQRAIAAGKPITTLPLDVCSDASVEAALQEIEQRGARVDVLINNAGIMVPGAVEDVTLADAQEVFAVNYLGAMRVTRALLPQVRNVGGGQIINISSMLGRCALPCLAHYAASKYALEGATEALAMELAPLGIRVALVEPGIILTPIFTKRPLRQDPSSAYAAHLRRVAALVEARMRDRTLPRAVGEAVCEILAGSPRFRHLVGADAHALAGMRARVSDEEFLATSQLESDESYFGAVEDLVGSDLFGRGRNSPPV